MVRNNVDDETSDFLRFAHGATTVQAVFLFYLPISFYLCQILRTSSRNVVL